MGNGTIIRNSSGVISIFAIDWDKLTQIRRLMKKEGMKLLTGKNVLASLEYIALRNRYIKFVLIKKISTYFCDI